MSLEQVQLLRLLAMANYHRQMYSKYGCRKNLNSALQYESQAESKHIEIEGRSSPYKSSYLYVNR